MAEGYHDFVAAEVLTAANLEDYCQNQAVMRFATSTTRDSALASVKTEGMVAYLEDVNTLTIYTGSTWSTVGPVLGAWMTYTPTLTQSGAVTKTVTSASYMRIGRTVVCNVLLTVTGAGTAANPILIGLPINAAGPSNAPMGSGAVYDVSATTMYPGISVFQSATTCGIFGAATGGGLLGQHGFTLALAAGDLIMLAITYEAAADA